jgi:hypothetical protein
MAGQGGPGANVRARLPMVRGLAPGRPRRRPRSGPGWLAAVALALAGCAGAAAGPRVEAPADVAGEWRGEMSGRTGRGAARLVVRQDGTYEGTLFLDGGDRSFRGVIMVPRLGPARYEGTNGSGTVALSSAGGARVLRLRPDGGGGLAELIEAAPAR